MRVFVLLGCGAVALGGCSKHAERGGAMMARAFGFAPKVEAPQPVVDRPQIAYTYAYTFQLPGDRVAALEAQHASLCRSLDGQCRTTSSHWSRDSDDGAELVLEVDARLVPRFGAALEHEAEDDGGTLVLRHVESEDLTGSVIDLHARLAGKQALAARLLALINSRSASVGDLVAAEKAYSEAQTDIESAQAELATAKRRVVTSTVTISYQTRAGSGGRPIGDALQGFSDTLASSLGALITFIGAVLPWLVLVVPGLWLLRRLVRRIRNRRAARVAARG